MKEKLDLDFPLVTDEDLDLIRKANLVDKSAPKSLRGFAVIDKAGNILHSQEVNPFGEEAENIISFAAEKINNPK